MTGHLTIRHTDYFLSGRGLDVSVTRIYTTVVAYREKEDEPGEYVPIATYQEAPTDLGCGWSLDFPWLEIDDQSGQPGKYLHLPRGVQLKTHFQNGCWVSEDYGFSMCQTGETYIRYRNDGIQEEFDSKGRLISITDLNGNVITFTYSQAGYSEKLTRITDTVGRVLNFNYVNGKLMSISDGIRTVTYSYSGDRLVAVQDPLGRVTTYSYLSQSDFLITGVNYPTGGFSSYEYAVMVPPSGKLAPYKASNTEDGQTTYYVYKVDSADTLTWSSPQDINAVSASAGRPCVFQRDDGSLVMYYKDKYVWTEKVWKCAGGECWEEIITHTEYWIKRSVSIDQYHWSSPENVLQVKSTTGNPVIIEKQDGSFLMYYKDQYVWTEQNCYWEGCPRDCQYICETITHTEYWIYRRTSSDGLIWQSPVKMLQTTLGVRDISVIQKQDSSFLMCYTDKVGSLYYIRQMTSSNGLSWSSPSNAIQVNSQTGNPALLQRNSGVTYLAYRKDSNVYVSSNSGSGWSSPVQTTASAQGDPALLDIGTDIVIVYKGVTGHFCRISSPNGVTWSSPLQIAPNPALSEPAAMMRKDQSYRIVAQYISASALDLVKVTEFSYEGETYLPWSSDVLIRDAQTLRSSMHFEYDSKGRTIERVSKDEDGVQTEKIVYAYSGNNIIRQDVYAGTSVNISYSVITGYDNNSNAIYTRYPEGAEHFYSYANTNYQNQFVDSKGSPVNLFSNQFYTNNVPANCHTLPVGEAFINKGKVTETYYRYDARGNLVETKTLFPTRDYKVFSGTFSEPNQTSFEFDLSGLTITDGILVISSIAVPYPETLYETHSEVGTGWLNTGTWQGKYFMANYHRCHDLDCYDGQTKIGPFEHYPGSPNYTGYTTWVEDRTQYVKASYSAIVNEYPEKVEYNLNSSSWGTINDNLGSGTTSITVPVSSLTPGSNILQFRESSIFSTKFEWTLYMNKGTTPEEFITSYNYDFYGNITSITDAEGHSRTLSFSPNYGHAYLTSVTDALGYTLSVTYDFPTGLITAITSRNGTTSTYEYDLLGRITKKINADLSEKEAIYDDLNNCTTVYDELDHFIKKYYDGLNRLEKVEWYINDQLYGSETYTYDYLNNVLTKTDPEGHLYRYEYDSRGKTTKIVNPDGTFKLMEYDDSNGRARYTDENGHFREYFYDWVQRLISVKEYMDPVNFYLTQYEYDEMGNVTKIINANDEATFLEYSFFGPTAVVYPDGTSCLLTYDRVGNILSKTDENGATLFEYDATNRQIQIRYPDQSTVNFSYDSNGNRLSVTSGDSTATYTYDNRNRPTSMIQNIDGVNYSFLSTYDAAGRLISLTYPDGTGINRTYDDINRLTSVGNYAEFAYSEDSLLEVTTYANGVMTTYNYDDCHRPLSIITENERELLYLGYAYDAVGNVTQLTSSWIDPFNEEQTSSESYGYDALDRLIFASNGIDTVSFSYDPVGNRVQQIVNGETTVYTYISCDRLAAAGEWAFAYDANGNTLSKISSTDEWSCQYDVENHIKEVQHNGQVVGVYTYDGDGQRIKKTEWNPDSQQTETTIYLYVQGSVYYEKNITTDMDALYFYGPAGRIAKKIGEETMYYHTDHTGSTRLLTDSQGNPVTSVRYYSFGDLEVTGNEKYLFTGQEKDSTGLYYYKARYFDPETGRFLTRDSRSGDYRRPQTLNKYVYCMNNPLKYTDPTGNVSTGDDELDELMAAQDSEESSQSQESQSSAYQLGYTLSTIIALKFAAELNPMGFLDSQKLMREIELMLTSPEDMTEFEKGWKEGYTDANLNYASPAEAEKRCREVIAELEDDVQCLMDYVGNELMEVAMKNMIPGVSATIPAETMQAIIYIAEESYNLSCTDKYGPPPDNLTEMCKEENRGMCLGSLLLCFFLWLAVLTIFLEKRRPT